MAALLVAIISTASYGSGAHTAVRYLDPPMGAWWNASEFAFMTVSAAALGILVAIGAGLKLVAEEAVRRRVAIASIIVGAIIVAPLASGMAAMARLGWMAEGGLAPYAETSIVDKLLIAGVYSLKIAGFSLIAGLAMVAMVAAVIVPLTRVVPSREALK